jgi:hypothetical protein
MPIEIKPKENENDFISRCVGEEINAGKEQDVSVAICYSYWREQHKMSAQELFISQMNEYRLKNKID